jgi:CRISPR-associated protein Cas2
MRVFVMFDLPTNNKTERSYATRFRNELVKQGFYMLQYSVYVRVCPNIETAQTATDKVNAITPGTGAVRAMIVTEKQYNNMFVFLGNKYRLDAPETNEKRLYQESFFDDDGNIFL